MSVDMPSAVTAPSSMITKLPPTIFEEDDEEITQTTATYNIHAVQKDPSAIHKEYSHSLIVPHPKSADNHQMIIEPQHHQPNITMIEHMGHGIQNSVDSFASSKLSGLSPPNNRLTPNDSGSNHYVLDDIIDGMSGLDANAPKLDHLQVTDSANTKDHRTPSPDTVVMHDDADKMYDIQMQIMVHDEEEDDDPELPVEYIDYVVDVDNKKKRTVRFEEPTIAEEKETNNDISELNKVKSTSPGITMHDILGSNGNLSNMDRQVTDSVVTQKSTFGVEDSVASGHEPSWFAAWFRKGANEEKRVDALLHFSDLSWRRMKKVAKEVNMSAVGKDSLKLLFKKYARSRSLETKGIQLEEYDECMAAAWISCWENMNDSLLRFAKSEHYTAYLESIRQPTIKRLSTNDMQEESEHNEDGQGGLQTPSSHVSNVTSSSSKRLKSRFVKQSSDGDDEKMHEDEEQHNHHRERPIVVIM